MNKLEFEDADMSFHLLLCNKDKADELNIFK